jgi:hypothetical protein
VSGHRALRSPADLASYRIAVDEREATVSVARPGRSTLVLGVARSCVADVAHAVAATLMWERDESIVITGCPCVGEHVWDVER